MAHTITPEGRGFRIDFGGDLTVQSALAALDELDACDVTTEHHYELVDLSDVAPLELSVDDLHQIARRAVRTQRRTGIRLALAGPKHVVGSHAKEYAHILGSWIMPAMWNVRDFETVAEGREWAAAAP